MTNRRKADRVQFDPGFGAHITGIDGSWSLPCDLEDVSATGAKLSVKQPPNGHDLQEFFLLLAASGGARRRCKLVWRSENTIGARFLADDGKNDLGAERISDALKI